MVGTDPTVGKQISNATTLAETIIPIIESVEIIHGHTLPLRLDLALYGAWFQSHENGNDE